MEGRVASRRAAAVLIAAAFIPLLFFGYLFWGSMASPPQLILWQGEEGEVDLRLPFRSRVVMDGEQILRFNGAAPGPGGVVLPYETALRLQPEDLGQARVEVRLGALPIRRLSVQVLPRLYVIPGGQAVGITVRSNGIIVVGHAALQSSSGEEVFPAREAGLRVGDVILKVGESTADSPMQIKEEVEKSGRGNRPVILEIQREGEIRSLAVQPILDPRFGEYRIGLYIRDRTAGVGTLTFYEPATRFYGALGHMVTDNDTRKPVDIQEGQLVRASIQGIESGRRGQPGEKRGIFFEGQNILGNILRNTEVGIFGELAPDAVSRFTEGNPELFPVAAAGEVKEGPAEILTVLSGSRVERFSVRIEKVIKQKKVQGKGLVIQIDDPRLLDQTGGIVQGMSGSPIIQDGKLIGAVTHVLVNEPRRGFGVHIDWMILESGLLEGLRNLRRAS
ncbi:MAG: SpoIVB peptidase [Firmicutes bacterium]|nr:SpoIVB peptidase [Bacillota bacterium]